jgi:hypothetical protein
MINWEVCERKLLWPDVKVLSCIRLHELRKTAKTSVRIGGLRAKL